MVMRSCRRVYYYDVVAAIVVIILHAVWPLFPETVLLASAVCIHLVLMGKMLHVIEIMDREATITKTIQTIQRQLQ